MSYLASLGKWDILSIVFLIAVAAAILYIRHRQIRTEKKLEEELADRWAEDIVK